MKQRIKHCSICNEPYKKKGKFCTVQCKNHYNKYFKKKRGNKDGE